MSTVATNMLVLCTGNSARSILGEALITYLGKGAFKGYSAGSTPKGAPHPMALEVLAAQGLDIEGLSSKSWAVFEGADAPDMKIIVTVCDNAHNEVCPVWPGHPCQVHWGLPDPAMVEGSGQRAAFEATFAALKGRIECLLALPLHQLSSDDLKVELARIHESEPVPDFAP